MGKQNKKLLKNIELYEQKEKIKQSKSKVLGQKPAKYQGNKEKVHACTTPEGVKVYAVWYK